jgi:hypothetical protein
MRLAGASTPRATARKVGYLGSIFDYSKEIVEITEKSSPKDSSYSQPQYILPKSDSRGHN